MYDYEQALERSRTSRTATSQERTTEVGGRTWTVLPDVFSPADSPSTAAQLGLLEVPEGASFLEIGAGTGVIAVSAALEGASHVWALDVNPEAVRNCQINAERHGVADRVTTAVSDLFDALPPNQRFDVIYWHSNNVWVPSELALSLHELAYVDPGYASHARFFREAGNWTTATGRVLIGLSSRAEHDDLNMLAASAGRSLGRVRVHGQGEAEGRVEYQLWEVR